MDIITPVENIAAAFVGGVTAGTSWKTTAGRISLAMLVINVATAITLAFVVDGLCDFLAGSMHFDVSWKIRIGLCAMSGYLGPALTINPIYGVLLKRFGGTGKNNDTTDPKQATQH